MVAAPSYSAVPPRGGQPCLSSPAELVLASLKCGKKRPKLCGELSESHGQAHTCPRTVASRDIIRVLRPSAPPTPSPEPGAIQQDAHAGMLLSLSRSHYPCTWFDGLLLVPGLCWNQKAHCPHHSPPAPKAMTPKPEKAGLFGINVQAWGCWVARQ